MPTSQNISDGKEGNLMENFQHALVIGQPLCGIIVCLYFPVELLENIIIKAKYRQWIYLFQAAQSRL